MAYTVYEGSTLRFYTSKPFTSISGTVVDPDKVEFSYQVQGQAVVTHTYTNGSGDPTGTIVRVATGDYYADIDTSGKSGVWTWRWFGYPVTNGPDTTHTQVATEGSVTVSIKGL